MKRGKSETRLEKYDSLMMMTRNRSIQFLAGVGFLYLLLVTVEMPFVFKAGFGSISQQETRLARNRLSKLEIEAELLEKDAPARPVSLVAPSESEPYRMHVVSGLRFDPEAFGSEEKNGSVQLGKMAMAAWMEGGKLWKAIESGKVEILEREERKSRTEQCPQSVSLTGKEFSRNGNSIELPCGLTLGSHLTVVGRPRKAHAETNPRITLLKENGEPVMVSQFKIELQGLKTVDGEDPPRILHFNPRIKGDWSENPVIEQNTCYRQQWGTALRCEGWRSKPNEETVDGQVKCENWIRDDDNRSAESKSTWWLNRIMGRTKKVDFEWPFPFAEEKLFVLTLGAWLEGYHVTVDGRHVTSFPYRTGFTLDDATGFTVNGDVDVEAIVAASLPTAHPSFAPERHLEMQERWRAPPVGTGPIELFIGVLSAGNHFAERMAVRKSWMQHRLIRSSQVVARFFVALHARKEVDLELKKEAEFFGDTVIVPYMDNYDLVVLKTVAICHYGVRTLRAKYVMKGDDDTFVRPDAVLDIINRNPTGSIYVGNMNYYHRPLRHGKWAVTYEEWPEEVYPPYANGPGYILSADIARFVYSEFEKHKLRLFKMEDVSMGMWVEKYNSTKRHVAYVHSLAFCQFGCVDEYYTAHYQSPRQMICLWDKLQSTGRPECCNMR